jgi:hypothetical protein
MITFATTPGTATIERCPALTLAMVSHPDEVVKLTETAAEAAPAATAFH